MKEWGSTISIRLLLTFVIAVMMIAGCQAQGLQPGTQAYDASLLADLKEREMLPETDVPMSRWYTKQEVADWGPMAKLYPGIDKLVAELPPGTDVNQWKRDRVVAIAKHYIGLPYRHHHIPAWAPTVGSNLNPQPGPGLDCSNFTAWVYNFGFGIALNSDVEKQGAFEPRPGYGKPEGLRRIEPSEGFLPGDILYILDAGKTHVVHAIIYIDEEHIIDSTDTHVDVRHFAGWYKQRLSHGARIFN